MKIRLEHANPSSPISTRCAIHRDATPMRDQTNLLVVPLPSVVLRRCRVAQVSRHLAE